jgi:Coenzyme PQQ synthesis protein D (PqqD)
VKNGCAELEDDVDKYRLNETGTRLWLAFDGSRTVAELAHELALQSSEDEQRCLADVRAFVAHLYEYQLVELV